MEDGIDYQSVPALDVPFFEGNISVQDDEMLSWLQYPLEDSFEKAQGSELLADNVNPHVHLMKDDFIHQTMRGFEKANDNSVRVNIVGHASINASLQRCTETQHPSETHVDAVLVGKASSTSPNINVDASFGRRKDVDSIQQQSHSFERQNQAIQHKFPLFSSSVAATLDNLLIVGAASGPTNIERVRRPLSRELISSCELPNNDSYPTTVMGIQKSELEKPSEGRDSDSSKLYKPGDLSERQKYKGQRTNIAADLSCEEDVFANNGRTNLKGNAATVSTSPLSENGTGTIETIVFAPEITGFFQSKATQGVSTASAEKSFADEESEDLEELVTTKKHQSSRPCTSKRSRAAEVHNESEKRRRNRINIKLKALQELIPNSTKTDKASVLDEAIEYTKLLQSQVQMMSMRSGFFLQPVMMPSGVQYLPVQQMPMLPHTGMKPGAGMGMGMGIIGMNTPHPNHQLCQMPGQSLQAYTGSQIHQAPIPIINAAQGHSPPTLHVKDPFSAVPPHQSLQSKSSHSNVAKNTLMLEKT